MKACIFLALHDTWLDTTVLANMCWFHQLRQSHRHTVRWASLLEPNNDHGFTCTPHNLENVHLQHKSLYRQMLIQPVIFFLVTFPLAPTKRRSCLFASKTTSFLEVWCILFLYNSENLPRLCRSWRCRYASVFAFLWLWLQLEMSLVMYCSKMKRLCLTNRATFSTECRFYSIFHEKHIFNRCAVPDETRNKWENTADVLLWCVIAENVLSIVTDW